MASDAEEVCCDALRERFEQVGYTADGVLNRIGAAGQAGLGRNVTIPASHALGEARDELATLIRLFILQADVPECDVRWLRELAPWLLTDGTQPGTAHAACDVRPYGSPDDGASGWVVFDLTPSLDFQIQQTSPDYVLGVSPASTTLAQLTMRDPVSAALDLGTGCGVQALHLARHAERVVATDINARAISLARLTSQLSRTGIDLRKGDLFAPVAGERFDLICSNPPFVMSPPSDEALAYRETNFEGDDLLRILLQQTPAHLNAGGSLQLLTNWAIVADQAWEDRLADFVAGTGLDLWVIERERLDVPEYIEMWLADAGLAGTDRWRPAYERWLAYFAKLRIEGVGMGWILATAAGRPTPHVRIEQWPHAVQQPVGAMFARHRDAVDAANWPTEQFLAARLRLADVRQETIGAPGAEDPEYVVFRQTTGLLRALRADTALAAALGALDGELTVAQVLAAVAKVLGQDPGRLAAELIPQLRRATEEQYLCP